MNSPPEDIALNNSTPTCKDSFQEKLVKGFKLLKRKQLDRSFNRLFILLKSVCSSLVVVAKVCVLFLEVGK